MKIWIHINGVQEGPYELADLPIERMTADTPVWYEGLDSWTTAGAAPVTAELLARYAADASAAGGNNVEEVVVEEVKEPELQPNAQPETQPEQPVQERRAQRGLNYQQYLEYQSQQAAQKPKEKCPPTYIVWSVLLTVLCCNPVGIVPIITGISVNSKFNNFNYKGAKRASNTTEWWLAITIVTSLIFLPFFMLINL